MGRFASYNTDDATKDDAPLGAGDDVIIGPFQTDVARTIAGSVFSDQSGDIYIEQSFDGGDHFDVSAHYSVSGNSGTGFQEPVLAATAQVRYVNGGTPQATLRLFCRTFYQGR